MSKRLFYILVTLTVITLLQPVISLTQAREPQVVYSLDWSPDGTRLGVVGDGVWIYDQNLSTAQQLETTATGAIAWSPDGTRLAIGNQIWDAQTFQLITTIETEVSLGGLPKSWSNDSTRVATLGNGNRDIVIFDATNGTLLQTIKGDELYIDAVDWSPDDTQFAVSRPNNTIALLDVQAGTISALYSTEVVAGSVTWHPDGKRVALTGSRPVDRGTAGSVETANSAVLFSVQIWDMTSGTLLDTFDGLPDYPQLLRWRPDGEELVGGSANGSVFVWNTRTKELASIFLSAGVLYDLDYSPLGGRLAMGSNPAQVSYADPTRRISSAKGPRVMETLANGTLEIAIPSPSLATLELLQNQCLQEEPDTSVEAIPDALIEVSEFINQLPDLSSKMLRADCTEEFAAVASAIVAEQ